MNTTTEAKPKLRRVNNYFRVGRYTFTFWDTDGDDVSNAYAYALAHAKGNPFRVIAWRPVPVPGPWSECELVGYGRLRVVPDAAAQ